MCLVNSDKQSLSFRLVVDHMLISTVPCESTVDFEMGTAPLKV